MASVIDILLRANTQQATTGMKKFAGSLDEVVRGLTGFSVSGLTATAAVVGVANEIKKAVKEYSEYATAIGKAAELSGIGAEEMSRLAQAADDVFVSQEALTRSFQMGLKNGFVPTIDNLAKLSDELVAMTDPAARAEKASEIFGRQWAEIAPFILQGGDAIREGTAAIEEGLIVTDEAVEQNIKYKESLDAWNDSITAVKNTLGADFLPILTDVLDLMNQLPKTTDTNVDAWRRFLYAIPGVGLALQISDSNFYNNRNEQKEWAAAVLESGSAARQMPDALFPVISAMGGYNAVMQNQASVTDAANAAVRNFNMEMDQIAGEMAGITQSITDAQTELADAQAAWQSGAGGQVAGLLEQQGLKGEGLITALAGVDEVMGTSLATQETYNQHLEAATAEFAKSGDLDAFKSALSGIKDEFMPLDERVAAATEKLQILQAQFDELDGRRISMYIDLIQNGGLPSGGGGGLAANQPPQGYTDYTEEDWATGTPGWMTVPPGYPNDSYTIGLTSGEVFNVANRQQQESGAVGGGVNIYVTQQPGESGEQLANRILGKMSRVSSAAGIRSAGG